MMSIVCRVWRDCELCRVSTGGAEAPRARSSARRRLLRGVLMTAVVLALASSAEAAPAVGGGRGAYRVQSALVEADAGLTISLHALARNPLFITPQDAPNSSGWVADLVAPELSYAPLVTKYAGMEVFGSWGGIFQVPKSLVEDGFIWGFHDLTAGAKLSIPILPVIKFGAMADYTFQSRAEGQWLDGRAVPQGRGVSVHALATFQFSELLRSAPNMLCSYGTLGEYIVFGYALEQQGQGYDLFVELRSLQPKGSSSGLFDTHVGELRLTPGATVSLGKTTLKAGYTFAFGDGAADELTLGCAFNTGLGRSQPQREVPDTKPDNGLIVRQRPGTAPRLSFVHAIADESGDKTLDGGEKVSLTVKVNNHGEGQADGVTVKLNGSSKALRYIGTSQTIGDIRPGETGEAKFEAVLPNRIEADNGSIIIHVTEANGFDALEEKELIVAMQPAKVTRETQVVSTLVDVDAPLEGSGYTRDDAYAVVVGINAYRSQALPKVTYAKKDAEAMRDYLVGVCGFKEGNIKLLTDAGASLSDLTAYCEEWLTRNVRKGSFVFVYFAGHGTPSPDKGEAYLVPYDGEPGFVSKLYPLSRLYASLAALPTDQVVVALDACFSGAGGRSVMEQGKRPLVAVDLEKEAQRLGNVAVLTASAGNEISQDLDAKRHGLFTYYLLKGLRGEADSDRDGWVTLGELYSYAKPKVLDESKRLGYHQTVQFMPQPTGARANVRLAMTK